MIPKPKALSFSKFVFITALILLLLLPASSTLIQAQETTQEAEVTAEPVVTEIATEAPTEEVEASVDETEATPDAPAPTEEVVVEATEAITEVPAEATEMATEPPTNEVTEEPIVVEAETTEESAATEDAPPEATESIEESSEVILTFVDNFDAFNGERWSLAGWEASEGTLLSTSASANASVLDFSPTDFELNVELFVSENNTASISFRANAENYRAMFSSNGSSRLYRGDELLDAYVMQAAESAWFSVHIIAAGDTISISVNDITGIVFTDSSSLGAGAISFQSGDTNSGTIMLDNLSITEVDATTIIFPDTAPAINSTPEAEVTQEVETTPEAEVTAEAETTPEAEVTEEVPVADVQMSEQLTEVIGFINNGQLNVAEVILQAASYEVGANGVSLKIYPAEGVHIAEVDQFLQSLNASVASVKDGYLVAVVSIENLPALSESHLIGQITKPASARSTGPIGSVYTEGFDALGVNDWHNAGYNGTNIKVGIVDTEFDGSGLNQQLTCATVSEGSDKHGMVMAEIICDAAPNATIFTYPLDTSLDAYVSMANNVYQAITDQIDVLLIAVEITDAVPGDGTGLEDGTDDPYIALETARNQGMAIFAGAGNFGATYSGGITALERSITLDVPAAAPDSAVATVTVRATAGDDIIIMWNDWTGLGASDAANIEGFDITVQLNEAQHGSTQLINQYNSTERPSLDIAPSAVLNLDPTAGIFFPRCPVDDSIGGGEYDPTWCYVDIIITRAQGDSPVTMQIMVAPEQQNAVDPAWDGNGDPTLLTEHLEHDIEIIGLSGLGAGVTQVTNAGTLARPADSPNVITVGGVCGVEANNFALAPDSAMGPIYGSNGAESSLNTTAPTVRSQTKPDIVSTTYTRFLPTGEAASCDGTVTGIENTVGAGGTSTAAAHVAGMTAVLLSNPNFSNLDFDGVRDYLQSHSAELPLGAGADGFDMTYGAGFASLGSPNYLLSNTQNPAVAVDALSCSNILYVGQANMDSLADGSLAQPYTNIAHAIADSTAGDCIVVMPGEYVTPIQITQNNINIHSYNQASSADYPASLIYVGNQYINGTVTVEGPDFADNAGLYIDGASNTIIDGFIFVQSSPYTDSTARRQAIFANSTSNTTLSNNTFGAVSVDGSSYAGFDDGDTTPVIIYNGNGDTLEDNTFIGNVGGVLADGSITVPSAAILNSNAGSPVLVQFNTFDSNIALEQDITYDYFASVLYTVRSHTDIVGNVFISNEANTIVGARTLNGGSEELRIVSNVFQNNRLDTETNGLDVADLAGTLVYGYFVPQLSFVNNTMVLNDFTDSGANGAILGRGSRTGSGGGVAATQLFDFANNLAYNNTFASGAAGVISAQGTAVIPCNALLGGSFNATVRNWWNGYDGSNCRFEMGIGDPDNLNNNDIATDPASVFFGVVTSRPDSVTDPLYYALSKVSEGVYSVGVDYSDIDEATELGNNIALNAAPFNLDALGESRIVDIENWENGLDTPDNATHLVDVGAYELSSLTTIADYVDGSTYFEDQPLIVVDLDTAISGGVGELVLDYIADTLDEDGDGNTIEIKPSSLPTSYGTQCGVEFTESNHGLVFGTGLNNLKAFYCPPVDFYTDDADSFGIPDNISFEYSATDETDIPVTGAVTFSITPLNDALLSSDINGDTNPDISQEDQMVIANIGQTNVRVRLRPFVNFDNFGFSEYSNPAFFDGSNYAVDYPFAYSGISATNTGLYAVTPSIVVGSNPYEVYAEFSIADNPTGDSSVITYTVTDANGGSSTYDILVRSVNRIPNETGIYDDTSFAFDYTDGWTFEHAPGAINNTLHHSQVAGDIASFGFKGTGFVLYMKGSGLLGGAWDLNIYIGSASTPATIGAWSEVDLGSGVYSAIISDGGNVKFECTTTAIVGGELSTQVDGFYTIACNSFDDSIGALADEFEDGETAATDTHLVEITNTFGRKITVDAFSLTDDNESPVTVDIPLPPGFHDVDELALRDAFGSKWSEVFNSSYSNGRAYQLSTVGGDDKVSFHVRGGTGFAIGTTIQATITDFTICVTNTSTGDLTCQNHDYNAPPVFRAAYNAFRPFYGLTPDLATTYRVDIIPNNDLLVIDSVVVYDSTVAPVAPIDGGVEDEEIDFIVYSGGINPSWSLNTLARGSSNNTLTSAIRGVSSPGPYVTFQVASGIDTVYWTYGGRALSNNVMVCVDRGLGVGTNSDVSNAPDTLPATNEVSTSHGNCIVVDLNTGDYWVIGVDGSPTQGVGSIRLVANTIILDEKLFRDDVDDQLIAPFEDVEHWKGSTTHTFEIFTLHDVNFAIDRIVAIGSNVPLPAGRYEEYTSNIDYLQSDLSSDAIMGDPIDSARVTDYTGDFTPVIGRSASRDFGGGVMFTNNEGYAIGFEFTGTGFAPAFRTSSTSEEVLICWTPKVATDTPSYSDVVANGTCQRFDNEARRGTYNAPRPIMGLPLDEYRVVMRFEGDNFSPAANRSLEPEMWFDGITVYNDDLTSLNQLVAGATYEANYVNRALLNNFAYFGNDWDSLSGIRARNYSSQNIDYIRRGDFGATIAFRTTNANAITLTRPLGRYTSYLVCATNEADATDRTCQLISNDGRANMADITMYLTQDTIAPFGDYIVTVTAADSGAFYFDAIRPESITQAITVGTYDDNHPAIIYNYSSRDAIKNGDMEKDPTLYWSTTGGTLIQSTGAYNGRYVGSFTTSSGTNSVSQDVELVAGNSYTLVAYVFVDLLTPDTIDMTLSGYGTVSSDINRLGQWQMLRIDIEAASSATQSVSFAAQNSGTIFKLDHVQLIENSNWQVKSDRRAYGGYTMSSTSHGSSFTFGFTGTGFALGIPTARDGGEVEVCYAVYNPLVTSLTDVDTAAGTCVTYQNEESRGNSESMRLIEGLSSDNYAVTVRDVEDGNTVAGRSYPAIRSSRTDVGIITVDYIHVFDSSIPTVTDSGTYNENAANTVGEVYLQTVPASSWDLITGRAAIRYSNESYITVVDSRGRSSRVASGPTAMLNLDLTTYSSARVIFDMYQANPRGSEQLLACVDGVDGVVEYDGENYSIVDSNGAVNCALLDDLTTSRFITLSPDNLPLLGVGGANRTLTIQTLTGTTFQIDGYQVLYGDSLVPGFYEETIGTDILTASSEWAIIDNRAYSGGTGLSLTNSDALNPLPTATMDFTFNGTGLSIVSAFASNGGTFDISITNLEANPAECNGLPSPTASTISINDTGISTVGSGAANITYAGLPCDTYQVSLTANADLGQQVVFDAIEIYGPVQVLGSMYDDALTDTDGNLYITYGPTTDAWLIKEDRLASTALNQTLHVAQKQGAVASFQIGATNAALDTVTTPAKGIVLYYGAGTAITGDVQVCFRDVTAPGAAVDCQTPDLVTIGGTETVIPAGGDGAYYTTVTLLNTGKTFALDAIQVLEAGLHEGIFDAEEINADLTTSYTGTGAWNSTTNMIELPASSDSVSFDVTGVALSIVLSHTTTSSTSYEICIEDLGVCDVVSENLPVAGDIVPTAGTSAVTYAGLHDAGGAERTVTVTLTNTGTGTLFIKELHVLSGDTNLQIADTARYENTAAQIRYLPFGSLVENSNVRGNQSEGSEHSGTMQGAAVYFEFVDIGANSPGFEYIRQMSTRGYGSSEICYGQIGSESSSDIRDSNCSTVANNTVSAYQVAEAINSNSSCGGLGCWATIRGIDNLTMPFDFVRLYEAGGIMAEGYYEDNYPGLNYEDDTGGAWDIAPLADSRSSGGFVNQAIAETSISSNDGPVMWFTMNGTGFSINFTMDVFADAIEICYAPGQETSFANVKTNVLDNGICQTFDNEERRTTYTAARTITGIPQGNYTVAVRMLPDNNTPAAHNIRTLPISMKIDSVNIYNQDWTTYVAVVPSDRYEPSYVSRDLTNNFAYIGDNWNSASSNRARRHSGQNYDYIREYGAAVAFHTQGANAVTLYTDLVRGGLIRMCSVPVDAGITTITNPNDIKCMDFDLNGRGNQQPFSFRFSDFGMTPNTDYLVSIAALNASQFTLDAIELSLTGPLPVGLYEGSDANLYYDNNYTNHIINGTMELNDVWTEVGTPSLTMQSGARYEGRYGWHVEGNTGNGIQSNGFDLTDSGVIYTLQARAQVLSGGLRIKLVEGNDPVSIQEFSLLEPSVDVTGAAWTSIRVDFVLEAGNVPYNDVHVQFLANGSNAIFNVDDVSLTQGGLWANESNRRYSNEGAWRSQTSGASMLFSFEGTGVEIGTTFDTKSGEMEVCYDDDTSFDEASETGNAQSCFIYQNEERRTAIDVGRTITGLPFGTYYVRLRDVEDGFTVTGRALNTIRSSRSPIGQIAIDYIQVLGNPQIEDVSNAILTMNDLAVPAGYYNENAINPNTDKPYIHLYPEGNWGSEAGRRVRGYTNESYIFVADDRGRAARAEAGQAAVLYVDVPAEGATVILYSGPVSRQASKQILICAGDGMSGEIVQEEILVNGRPTLVFSLESPTTPSDCVLRDMTTSGALIVDANDLSALGTVGIQRVMFTNLATGQFNIDAYQVIEGTALAPGIYDEYLPDNLLNFEASNNDTTNPDRLCDQTSEWCQTKVRGAFGDNVVRTQNLNASLNFDIMGTGFSVLTEVGTGAQMRVCYAQTPSNGAVSFPSREDTLSGGNFSWDNSTQNLATGGIWCELFTTNTVVWDTITPDRTNPVRGAQYGFSFYGLPYNTYSVQVLVFEDDLELTRNSLAIDAIAVFDNYNNIPIMGPGFYDDSEASLSLEPVVSWAETTSRVGPPRGPFNLTESTASNAGSIAQMRVDGNAVTLFQTINTRNTADARMCVVVTGAVIHCTPEAASSAVQIQNPDASAPPYALAVELASFSQSGRRTYFTPIMFYGLGISDTTYPHRIIIENREHGRKLSIDAILVQD